MSTPDNHGKKAPQFAAFKPLTTVQNANDCCCDGACSSTPTLSENVSGTRYSWKVSGMDCAACARKVENAVRQLAGVNQVQVLFATEKLVVDADNDIRAQVESALQKAGYSLRDEQAAEEPQASRLKENLPQSAGVWSSSIIRSGNWRLSRPRWLGCTRLLVRHYG